jgi:hypothetical protein
MADYEIGDLVEVFNPYSNIFDSKKTIAIVVDNISRPSKNTIKIFWHYGYTSWIPVQWVKKIDDDKEVK